MKEIFVTGEGKYTKRAEGDVWEENGKTWTIKNGLKRTKNKLDEARRDFRTPMACPECNAAMKHHLDEKMWTFHKLCFSCVIEMEHKLMKAGKYDEYERDKMMANAGGFMKDLKDYFEDAAIDSNSKSHVTEDGIIEKWKDVDSTRIEEIRDEVISNLNDKVNDINTR